MYNLDTLLGKVVTVRSIDGSEIICKLLGVNEDKSVLTVGSPKVVVIDSNTVMMMPFALTSAQDTVYLNTQNVFAVMETMAETAKDYNAAILESQGE